MNEFLKFYDSIKHKHKWRLEIAHTSIVDWLISISDKKDDATIIHIQHCDIEYAFAKAQIELKEWLLNNEGGY